MTHDLYVERWLLALKQAAEEAGFQAHVRALDRKGGRRVALELGLGSEAIEICFYKRRLGARTAAAATGSSILPPAIAVVERVLGKHQGLLESGLRRFHRRNHALLSALWSQFDGARSSAELSRASFPALGQSAPACAAARAARGLPRRFEAVPAYALRVGGRVVFVALVKGGLRQLADLVLPRRASRRDEGKLVGVSDVAYAAVDVVDGALMAVELARGGIELVKAGAGGGESATEATALAAEVPAGLVEAVDPALAAAGAAAETASTAVAQVAESGGSCLSDAACAGIDCGGLDCLSF